MIRTAFLMTLLTMLLVLVGGAMGGKSGMMIAFAIGLGLNFINFWFSSSLVLKVYGARELPADKKWVEDDVREMASRAGLPIPKVVWIPKDAPNAFATGRSPQHAVVAVTEGLLRLCPRNEVRAVMAHELAHVRHRDMLTMTLVSGAVSAIGMLSMMARWGAIFGGRDREGGHPIAQFAIALIAPLMAAMVQMGISRAREYEADRGGAEISGEPLSLASALARLHAGIPHTEPLSATGATAHMMIANPFAGMGLGKLFSTHPDPQERIARLRAMAA